LAIVHTCIFDAWAAYDETAMGTRLGAELRQPAVQRTEANKQKAISFAAYRSLTDLFPSQIPILFDPLMHELGFDPSDASLDPTTPSGIGNRASLAVLSFRHADGSNQLGDVKPEPYSDYSGYSPTNSIDVLADPDRWQPLRVNGFQQRWLLPQWRSIRPFALQSGSQLRSYALARGPYRYPTPKYWAQANEVIDLSAHLGDTEKVIAEYWADGPFSETPPGHWNVFAQVVSHRDHHTLDQDAKLFFILNNAMLDTSIAVWDIKLVTDAIRPISVIRFVFGSERKIRAWGGPGLGTQLISCKDFRSYIPTPPFSTYVSGHSAFSAAAAEVLRLFTGSDTFGYSFTAAAGSSLIERGLTPARDLTLSWPTFTDAAVQAGLSRRYGGIHFESDDLVGRDMGRLIAIEVWSKSQTYLNDSAR
jgi:membrane-associated phospholipid phosphatase